MEIKIIDNKNIERCQKPKGKKGFTLAEILIVVAIIAILVAISVPLFGGALDRAEKAVFDANQSTIKSMGVAMLLSDDDVDFEANKVFYAYAFVQDGNVGTVMIAPEKARAELLNYGADTYEKWAELYGDWDYCLIIVEITVFDLAIAK